MLFTLTHPTIILLPSTQLYSRPTQCSPKLFLYLQTNTCLSVPQPRSTFYPPCQLKSCLIIKTMFSSVRIVFSAVSPWNCFNFYYSSYHVLTRIIFVLHLSLSCELLENKICYKELFIL